MAIWNAQTGLNVPVVVKFLLSLVIDGIDLIMGPLASLLGLPGLSLAGTFYDIGATGGNMLINGQIGIIGAWEILAFSDIGNTADGFVPTTTLTTGYVWWRNRKNGKLECPEGQVFDEELQKCIIP